MLKIIFLYLSALLLLQYGAEGQTDTNDLDTPPYDLLIFATDHYSKLFKHTVEGSRKIFKDVITEGLRTRNRGLRTHISELAEFVEEAEQLESTLQQLHIDYILETLSYLFDLFQTALELIDSYDSDDFQEPSEDIKKMHRLLKKYGSDELIVECLKSLSNLLHVLEMKANVYLSTLEEPDKQLQTKMFDWSHKFKGEPDVKENLKLILEFFTLFSGEDYASDYSFGY